MARTWPEFSYYLVPELQPPYFVDLARTPRPKQACLPECKLRIPQTSLGFNAAQQTTPCTARIRSFLWRAAL